MLVYRGVTVDALGLHFSERFTHVGWPGCACGVWVVAMGAPARCGGALRLLTSSEARAARRAGGVQTTQIAPCGSTWRLDA